MKSATGFGEPIKENKISFNDISDSLGEAYPINPKSGNEQNQRYIAESRLLYKAISGDLNAAKKVLKYLRSTHQDLRMIMQAVLHDCRERRLWRLLLNYLAMGVWNDYCRLTSEQVLEQRKKYLNDLPDVILTQSIAEVFILDESEIEKDVKEGVLFPAVMNRSEPLRCIRYAAAWILGLRGETRVIATLDEMIDTGGSLDDQMVVTRAIEALTAINDKMCGPPLLKALAMGRGEIHQQARCALSDLGRSAEPAWIDALRHTDSHIRWHAARALGQFGDPRGVDMLAEGLNDESRAVRRATARVLAQLDAAAIPAILKVLVKFPLNECNRPAIYNSLNMMPSNQTKEYLSPLIEALRSSSAMYAVPSIAQKMLSEWNVKKC